MAGGSHCLEDSTKPIWSLSVRKREYCEERTQRVTLTQEGRNKTQKKKVELPSDEEVMDKQLDQMERILKQAVQYVVKAFKELKAKYLSSPEKGEEPTGEVEHGEEAITETAGEVTGSAETEAAT